MKAHVDDYKSLVRGGMPAFLVAQSSNDYPLIADIAERGLREHIKAFGREALLSVLEGKNLTQGISAYARGRILRTLGDQLYKEMFNPTLIAHAKQAFADEKDESKWGPRVRELGDLVFFFDGDLNLARNCFSEAVRLGEPLGNTGMGQIAEHRGDHQEALKRFEAALISDDPEAHFQMARFVATTDPKAAVVATCLEAAGTLGKVEAYFPLGRTLWQSGNKEGAARAFTRARIYGSKQATEELNAMGLTQQNRQTLYEEMLKEELNPHCTTN